MAASGLALAARQRNVEIRSQFIDCESFADDVYRAKAIQQAAQFRGLYSVDLDVPVLRRAAHEQIANTAANQQRATAFRANRLSQSDNFFGDWGHR